LMQTENLDRAAAHQKAEALLPGLFAGWHDPVLRRTLSTGTVVRDEGLPLRAMLAYLFGEVAKNFYLIHNPGSWIEYVRLSQFGDRTVDLDPASLPQRDAMLRPLDWEGSLTGPELMDLWLERHRATPFDYNRGLDDESLSAEIPPEIHRLAGSNFFRGLALIDLAEAMLHRAFGRDAVAVRVNAAGQGDYFQVHVDTSQAKPAEVQEFLQAAFCQRFGLQSEQDFVQLSPGGGAVGVRLSRYDALPRLIARLRNGTQ